MENIFTLPELVVTYTALRERCERLEELYSQNEDIKLRGEIEFTKSALQKIKNIYLSQNGNLDYLK